MASDTAKYQQVILGNNILEVDLKTRETQTAGWYQAVRMPTSPHIHHVHLALDVSLYIFSLVLNKLFILFFVRLFPLPNTYQILKPPRLCLHI